MTGKRQSRESLRAAAKLVSETGHILPALGGMRSGISRLPRVDYKSQRYCHGGQSLPSSRTITIFFVTVGYLALCAFRANPQSSSNVSHAKVSVLTQHNDNARTGANLAEIVLTPRTVDAKANLFGKLFSVAIDGNIYAQPLYAANVVFPSGDSRDVLYVATARNNVYAIDADTGQQIWAKNLGPPVPASDVTAAGRARRSGNFRDYKDIYPDIGITATPVIDIDSNTIFVVAKTKQGSSSNPEYYYRLHAMSMQTGADVQQPVEIRGSVEGTAADAKNGRIIFDSFLQLNRPGLLLVGGMLYVAFGSNGEIDPFHGWVFGYKSSAINQPALVLCTTPDKVSQLPHSSPLTLLGREGGGIWQSGNGLAADEQSAIYVSTGNGIWDGERNFSDSYLKLDKQLKVVDWFTPWNHADLDNYDLDLGSGGPVLLPGQLLVGGGKDGRLFVIRSGNLGHISSGDCSVVQELQITTLPRSSLRTCNNCYHHLHGSPVVWPASDGLRIYIWPEMESLKVFRFVNGNFIPAGEGQTSAPKPVLSVFTSMPGGILALSANGDKASTAIVWASIPVKENANHQNVPGVLRAFDASDVTKELWNSELNQADQLGYFAKFCAPTIANGRVYMATFAAETDYVQTDPAHIVVYGLFGNSGRRPPPEYRTVVH